MSEKPKKYTDEELRRMHQESVEELDALSKAGVDFNDPVTCLKMAASSLTTCPNGCKHPDGQPVIGLKSRHGDVSTCPVCGHDLEAPKDPVTALLLFGSVASRKSIRLS